MREKQSTTYNPAADVLRFLAILAVVLIHTSARTLESVSYDLLRVPWTLFLNQATRFAVPMFFMISGFVLELNNAHHTNYWEYIKKRISKILVPYVFWSAIYYLFVYSQNHEPFPQVLIGGSASYQLYFIPTLIIFYAVYPLIHFLYRVIVNRWVMIILGLVQIYILYYSYYVRQLPFFFPLSIALLNYYVFLLGIVASRHQEQIINFVRQWKVVLLFLMSGFLYIVFTEANNIYLRTRNYLAFTQQWRPSVLFYTLSFGALLYFFFNSHKFPLIPIKTLSKLSFFVFFIHIIFLEFVWSRLFLPFVLQTHTHLTEQIWFDPAFFLAVTLLSFGTAFLVHKIPFADKITG